MLVDVGHDVRRLVGSSSRAIVSARGTVWLTIDIVPPPTSFLVFTRPRSGSTPVVSQSMSSPIVPVGASTVAWELRTPNCSASSTASSQDCLRRVEQLGGDERRRRSRRPRRDACAARGASARRSRGSPRTVPSGRRRARARRVGVAGHERRDRGRPGPASVRVVREARGHQQRAEVRVAEAELAELDGVLADLLGRVVGVADEDLLGGEDHLDRGLEPVDVEACRRRRGTSAGSGSRGCTPSCRCACTRCRGCEPLMRPCSDAVCQSLIVVSNCRPGSAHSQAARAIWRHRSRARTVEMTRPVRARGERPVARPRRPPA